MSQRQFRGGRETWIHLPAGTRLGMFEVEYMFCDWRGEGGKGLSEVAAVELKGRSVWQRASIESLWGAPGRDQLQNQKHRMPLRSVPGDPGRSSSQSRSTTRWNQ